MFTVRPIPSSTPVDVSKVYNANNVLIEGRFWSGDGWALFEMRGQNKFAIKLTDLVEFDFAVYEEVAKTKKLPPIPKTLYERMRSFAELNLTMRSL